MEVLEQWYLNKFGINKILLVILEQLDKYYKNSNADGLEFINNDVDLTSLDNKISGFDLLTMLKLIRIIFY